MSLLRVHALFDLKRNGCACTTGHAVITPVCLVRTQGTQLLSGVGAGRASRGAFRTMTGNVEAKRVGKERTFRQQNCYEQKYWEQ